MTHSTLMVRKNRTMKRVYWLGRIGTKEVAIEEEETEVLACYAAGWAPEWCRVRDITEEVKVLEENGDMKIVSGANSCLSR